MQRFPKLFRNQVEFFEIPNRLNLNLNLQRSPHLHVEDTDWMKFIIRKGGDVNLTDENEKTLLHLAADLQQIEIVGLFLQHCDTDWIKFIIRKGGDVNFTDENGKTLLTLGC